MAQQMRLAGLRRGARRWVNELQLITTDGYETASRISALCVQTGERDERVLVAEAMQVLRAERASAGADLTLANDPVSMLAYGLGARPAGTDLTSLDDLLRDLGLSGEGDELRTHFDDVLAESDSTNLHLRKRRGAEHVPRARRRLLRPRRLSTNPRARIALPRATTPIRLAVAS